jgi:hypothetical protein
MRFSGRVLYRFVGGCVGGIAASVYGGADEHRP